MRFGRRVAVRDGRAERRAASLAELPRRPDLGSNPPRSSTHDFYVPRPNAERCLSVMICRARIAQKIRG
jgi:hypothetical protein